MEVFEKNNAEILKTFRMRLSGFEDTIYGRVIIVLNSESPFPYLWEISHHCMPFEDAADAYVPSRTYASTEDECKESLLQYMNKFTLYGIEKNKLF
jgi:hypothetical protein